jgi:hypothetical protein
MLASSRSLHDWDVVFILSKTRHTHDMVCRVRRESYGGRVEQFVTNLACFQSLYAGDFSRHDILMSYRHKRAANRHTPTYTIANYLALSVMFFIDVTFFSI